MATATTHPRELEAGILTRYVRPEDADLAPEAARALLALQMHPKDIERASVLGRKAQEGKLSAAEEVEIDALIRIDMFLSLLHSKARLSLKQAVPETSRKPGARRANRA